MSEKQIITIVGGGTAGWMSACLMAKRLDSQRFSIQVVESPDIQTVGVGEGSTPFLKDFFETLHIPEHDWMTACQATYKCGIRFPGWTNYGEKQSYIHPFYNELDSHGAMSFFKQCESANAVHPDAYFYTSQLAIKHQSPIHIKSASQHAEYGYHFDAGLLGDYLRNVAKNMGVTHIPDTVSQVLQANSGDIDYLEGTHSGKILGDFFVDCTGFKGLLIRQHMQRSYVSLKHRLFNDSAIAITTTHDNADESTTHLPSFTDSIAMDHGWMWRIPLQSRMGNGYVYSSAHCSREQAEKELRQKLDLGDQEVDFKYLHWEPGRLTEHWYRNCAAIGLSQGFLEPLEAPMLNIMQHSIEMLVSVLQQTSVADSDKRTYNAQVNGLIDGTMDYIQAHYLTNTRDDTAYWQAARTNSHRSAPLKAILNAWYEHRNINHALRQYGHTQPYFKTSWMCLLAGMETECKHFSDEGFRINTSDYFYHEQAISLLHDRAVGLAQQKEVKYG